MSTADYSPNEPSRPPSSHDAGLAGTLGAANTGRPRPATQATMLFAIPFASAMTDHDIALLARILDLATNVHPNLRGSPASPGVARLDFDSGLFLRHDATEGRWVLEARTWGNPPAWIVHDWHVQAAAAAHQLDPTVATPPRLPATTPSPAASSERLPLTLGRTTNKRLAWINLHIPGLG
ncbi:MAG: hypothetical protein ABI427_12625 [Solirubrobacteraceae bacterium]